MKIKNKKVQRILNNLFSDEKYHEYTFAEVTKIALGNIAIISFIFLMMFI